MLYLCTSCEYRTVHRQCYFQHLKLNHSDENITEDTIKKKLYTFKHKCSLCDYETNKKQDLKKTSTSSRKQSMAMCSLQLQNSKRKQS